MQVTPDGDYTRTGVRFNEFGYRHSVHSQHVPGPERSGLYYFRAYTAPGRRFAFPWIVAPARPTAKIAVLASNITWNAYNSFGGRSNYINADQLPPAPIVNARQELPRYTATEFQTWGYPAYAPLSFDRPEPINTIDQVFADPQIRHLGMAQPVRSHERGEIELVGQPVIMSRTPSRIRTPPPTMGEHTDEILAELGHDEAKIAALREAGVDVREGHRVLGCDFTSDAATIDFAPPDEMPAKMPSSRARRRVMSSASAWQATTCSRVRAIQASAPSSSTRSPDRAAPCSLRSAGLLRSKTSW